MERMGRIGEYAGKGIQLFIILLIVGLVIFNFWPRNTDAVSALPNASSGGGRLTSKNIPDGARPYEAVICSAGKEFSVEPELIVAIMSKENVGWDPNAESGCGAIGLMQVMPNDTSGRIAELVKSCGGFTCGVDGNQTCFSDRMSSDELRDSGKNISQGTKIIAGYLKVCGGDKICALRKYGPVGHSSYPQEVLNLYNSYKS